MTEVEVKLEAPALPAEKNEKEQKLRSPQGGRRRNKSDEAKREFIKFATKLRKQYGEDALTFQISSHPVGLEFSLRVDKKKEIKELTMEQKAKRAEKQAKRREYVEKKRQEKLENNAEDENGKEVPTGIAVG